GPSCSGKTTLGRALTRILPRCSLINQDNFYKPDSEIPVDPATGLDNWDTPDALDFPRFIAAIEEASAREKPDLLSALKAHASNAHLPTPPTEQLTQGAIMDDDAVDDQLIDELRLQYASALAGHRFVVVDGFLLFTHPEIVSRLDVRIFVTASRETLKRRRESRVGYITVEGFWQDPPGYFDRIVWPNFVLHH
ncbi:P-loop containing nucleoside triphosphate hydrolase protein, partial [Syncephalis pseudoplumigaleata]